jgi:pimeloyl-ACP methyl ester carboxylesterase
MLASCSYKRLAIVLALASAFQIVTLAQTAGAPQKSPPPLGRLVDVGGYRVHLYCIGTGGPAVVIVGAGFSFDWGLVQTEVSKFVQVCSYDHSGIGWSDSGPKDSCSLRVNEVHTALKNAGIKGPYVLVGHSLGALIARIFAARYADEVAGVVFVDHAISFSLRPLRSVDPKSSAVNPPPTPSTPGGGGAVAIGIENDPNFSKLSVRDRELHLWAMAQTRNQMALQSNHEMMPECVAEVDAITKEHDHPFGDKPLVDVTPDGEGIPEYTELQTKLLSLSPNSKQLIANNSGHFVIIDRPDVVVDAITRVVNAVRDKAKL